MVPFAKCISRALAILVAIAPAIAIAAQYTVTDLGTLDGTFSSATGINASGHISGGYDPPTAFSHPFLYDGTMHDLGTLGGYTSYGYDINDNDQVTGHSGTTTLGSTDHAFLYDGSIHDIGSLGGTISAGEGINNSGHVTGYSTTDGNAATHAFLYDGTTMHDLGTLGGQYSSGNGINNLGQVTGVSYTGDGGPQHAFIWTPTLPNGSTGSFHDLGTLGGGYSSGLRINDVGQVAGESQTIDGDQHAMWFDGTTMQDLSTLGGTSSSGSDINSNSMIVGSSSIDPFSDVEHAFIYTSATGMVDLNSRIDGSSGWILAFASGINDAGQITGGGLINGQQHAYLLTPVPEPTTVGHCIFIGALIFTRRRTRS
jgi:probable HAF family extracellular repeat protein